MAERSVLFVGMPELQSNQVLLPEGYERVCVDTGAEAIDQLLLAPPELIVASSRISDSDCLDFFREVIKVDASRDTPIVFVAPDDGMRPFLYQTSPQGFAVRYLDAEGATHTHFIREETEKKSYTVRALNGASLTEELAAILAGAGLEATEPTDEELEARLREIGFNNELAVAQTTYHVQSEVVELKPLTVATTVFSAGRAVFAQEKKLKIGRGDFTLLRAEVENIHIGVVNRVSAGDLA